MHFWGVLKSSIEAWSCFVPTKDIDMTKTIYKQRLKSNVNVNKLLTCSGMALPQIQAKSQTRTCRGAAVCARAWPLDRGQLLWTSFGGHLPLKVGNPINPLSFCMQCDAIVIAIVGYLLHWYGYMDIWQPS